MEMMAWSLSNEERAKVRQHFIALDKSQQGTIKLGDLKQVLAEQFNISNEETLQIFDALDSNHDEEIHYSDFLAAMVSTRIKLHDHLLQSTFKKFDVDSSGYITASNLRDVLGETWEGEQVEKLLEEADLLKDNRISFEEFKSYLRGDPLEIHEELATQVIDVRLRQGSKQSDAPSAESALTLKGKHAIEPAPEKDRMGLDDKVPHEKGTVTESTVATRSGGQGINGVHPIVRHISDAVVKTELCCAIS
eukprot:symbB.v1.2.036715.t1/scaffold5176.1/size30145/4